MHLPCFSSRRSVHPPVQSHANVTITHTPREVKKPFCKRRFNFPVRTRSRTSSSTTCSGSFCAVPTALSALLVSAEANSVMSSNVVCVRYRTASTWFFEAWKPGLLACSDDICGEKLSITTGRPAWGAVSVSAIAGMPRNSADAMAATFNEFSNLCFHETSVGFGESLVMHRKDKALTARFLLRNSLKEAPWDWPGITWTNAWSWVRAGNLLFCSATVEHARAAKMHKCRHRGLCIFFAEILQVAGALVATWTGRLLYNTRRKATASQARKCRERFCSSYACRCCTPPQHRAIFKRKMMWEFWKFKYVCSIAGIRFWWERIADFARWRMTGFPR